MTLLYVPFEEKEQAKALGARWNQDLKTWYIPNGLNAEAFLRWLKPKSFGAIIVNSLGNVSWEKFYDLDDVEMFIGGENGVSLSHDFFSSYISLIGDESGDMDDFVYDIYSNKKLQNYNIDSLWVGILSQKINTIDSMAPIKIGNIEFSGCVAFVLCDQANDEYFGMPDFSKAFELIIKIAPITQYALLTNHKTIPGFQGKNISAIASTINTYNDVKDFDLHIKSLAAKFIRDTLINDVLFKIDQLPLRFFIKEGYVAAVKHQELELYNIAIISDKELECPNYYPNKNFNFIGIDQLKSIVSGITVEWLFKQSFSCFSKEDGDPMEYIDEISDWFEDEDDENIISEYVLGNFSYEVNFFMLESGELKALSIKK